LFWPRHLVVTFSIQKKPDGPLSTVRALSSVAGPRAGGLIEYLEQLCLSHNVPCFLASPTPQAPEWYPDPSDPKVEWFWNGHAYGNRRDVPASGTTSG
jgi:hypothetical protein